ncbi:MAG: hypothetical protein WCD44_03960 [Candidatus Babeliales bacterium]
MSKKIIHLFLLFICIENTLTYSFDSSDVKSTIDWVWNVVLNHPIPAGIASGVGAHVVLDMLQNGSEDREITNKLKVQKTEKTAAETEKLRQQVALQNRPDWQEAQINLMAAEAFQKSDPALVEQRKRITDLQIQEATLETVTKKMALLDDLKKKKMSIAAILQNGSLSEEEKAEKYGELAMLGKLYNTISSASV